MEELKPCDITLLEKRLKNLSAGLENMDNGDIMVNRAMLTDCRDYMAELLTLRRAAPENLPCSDCSGIVYRQTVSGKIIPVDQRCGEKIMPPCYQPDGDGCAYQIYGDNNDEPIDRCKDCPLCYADKVRHTAPENKPLTIEHIRQMVGRPVYVESGTRLGNFYALVGDADGTEAALITTDTEHRLILRLADVASGEVKVYARRPEGGTKEGK